jgi:hypothetical protein
MSSVRFRDYCLCMNPAIFARSFLNVVYSQFHNVYVSHVGSVSIAKYANGPIRTYRENSKEIIRRIRV